MSSPAKCICPGNKVPFYCPVHGRVENPNWSGLKLRRSVERLQEQQLKPRTAESSGADRTNARDLLALGPLEANQASSANRDGICSSSERLNDQAQRSPMMVQLLVIIFNFGKVE